MNNNNLNNDKMTKEENWMRDFSLKDNLMFSSSDYVPILIEDIPEYIKSPGYDQECIKDIQTIGKVESIINSCFFLVSLNSARKTRIRAVYNFSFYDVNVVPTNRKNINDLEAGDVVKIFGCLRNMNQDVFLSIYLMLRVEDPEKSIKTLALASKLAARHYNQLHPTEKVEKLLEKTWDQMYKEKKTGMHI